MDRKLTNILIKEKGDKLRYKPANSGPHKENLPFRISRKDHGRFIQSQFDNAWLEADNNRNAVSMTVRDGIYVEIKGKEGYELITKSLEDTRQNIRLANVKKGEDGIISATIFIPNDKRNFFVNKISKYIDTETEAKVIGTIENINVAMIETFWVGKKDSIPKDIPEWCEIWLRSDAYENINSVITEFFILCELHGIMYKERKIIFPERVVVGIYANIKQLIIILNATSRLAEIRKMMPTTSLFTKMSAYEQREWGNELVDRVVTSNQSKTSVCLLDTGINNGHPLLAPILSDKNMHAIDIAKGTADKDGHGTRMAGIATYFNLEEKLENSEVVEVYHFLESVKIMDKQNDNDKDLYGAITANAISLAEIENPNINRSICMAITADTEITKDGRPSSWSGSVDSIIAGVYGKEDMNGEKDTSRLMFVSAGNTYIEEIIASGDYETAIRNHSVEDPGQAWNAITVGAFTDKVVIDDSRYEGFKPLAKMGAFSPYTSSSIMWGKKWPIKPEIVLEGGNLAFHNIEGYSEVEDLQLLTTSRNFMLSRPFDTISMTSSATAQASWMAANIQHRYPQLWPETIRALLIHSADWTNEMKKKLFKTSKPTKTDYRNLLRICGYGVPNLDKAIWSAENSVNLIIEDNLQPFIKKVGSQPTANEMHIHELPWPNDLLLELGYVKVKMKITLSYYIEPAPGEIGWKDKYRYPSCGLVFDVNNPTEDRINFLKRISRAMREDEKLDKGEVENDSGRWSLGTNNRDVGSIHSDIWEGYASELSQSNMIIVYPIAGWWKTRTNLKKYNEEIRYSLIVSIETPEIEANLYTAIKTKINNKVIIKTEITAI